MHHFISGYGNKAKNEELFGQIAFKIMEQGQCFGRCPTHNLQQMSGGMNIKITFTENKEFREFVYGNGFGKSLITFSKANEMIHVHRGKKVITKTRKFEGKECIMTVDIDGVKAKRYFRVE